MGTKHCELTKRLKELSVEKFRKTNARKNAPAEIKSENHAYHFFTIRMGLSIRNTFQDKIVNGDYYLGVMKRLLARISQVRPQYGTLGSWSLHDNVPPHKCIAMRKFLASKARFGSYS